MPCPCGASNDPMTLPFLSMWIIDGGRTQQSAIGGVSSAWSSISVRSFGRSNTQTSSFLSTARPVTPPSFHLFGSGLGQSGSNLYFGAAWPCPCARTPARRATQTINKNGPAQRASARTLRSFLMDVPPYPVTWFIVVFSTATLIHAIPKCHGLCEGCPLASLVVIRTLQKVRWWITKQSRTSLLAGMTSTRSTRSGESREDPRRGAPFGETYPGGTPEGLPRQPSSILILE